uniref:ANK_REP_REGION domain-containing protein n=1 Tax=Panagrellus redivivus TaxID=6233 RepID=A0A7E4UVP8_PANRE
MADARRRLDNLRQLLPNDDFFFVVFSMPDDQQPVPKPPELLNGFKRSNGLTNGKVSDPEDNAENEFLPPHLLSKQQKKSSSKKKNKAHKSKSPEQKSPAASPFNRTFDMFSKLQMVNPSEKTPSPEKVIIEDQKRKTDTTSLSKMLQPNPNQWDQLAPKTVQMKGFSALNQNQNSKKTVPSLIQSTGVKPGKLPPKYSQAAVTSTCNTVTTVSGSIPSVLGCVSQYSPKPEQQVMNLPPMSLASVNDLSQLPIPVSHQAVGRLLRPGPQTPHYAEALRLCDHDVLRMLGKQLVFEDNRGRFFKSILDSLIEGSVSKFAELFEMIFHHVRAEKKNKMFTNAQLKRQAMLQLLGSYISKSTDANVFMLLAAAWKPRDDQDTIIACQQLSEPHGYCGLIKFIGSMLRPTEAKALMNVKNSYSGRTALNVAAVAGSMCQMEALLKLGASTDTVDDVGNNPIHYVVRRVNLEYFLLLSHYGADLYACGIGPDGKVDTFAEYVVRACDDVRLRNFILNRLSALQTIFLEKSRQVFKSTKRDFKEILSGLHFARAFTPKLNTNKIELDFEFQSSGKSPIDRFYDDLVIMVIPFSYKDSDFYASAMEPELDFETLDPRAGELELIKGSLKFFDLNVFKTIFNFDAPLVVQTGRYIEGAFVFKLTPQKNVLPVRREGAVRGRLIFNTSGDSARFDKTLFAIQAFSVRRDEVHHVPRDVDGQWPVRHRLRDTLLIGNEYVKLNPKTLPPNLKRIPKTKYAENTDKKAVKKKSKKAVPFASPMAEYTPKSERNAAKKPTPSVKKSQQ